MKNVFIAIIMLLSAGAAYANSEPPESLFNKVGDQAQALGYIGYDVFLCLSQTNQLVVGGVSHWSLGLNIYLLDRNNNVIPTKAKSKSKDASILDFDAGNGNIVALALGKPSPNNSPYVIYKNAFLQVGANESAQVLTCYQRNSGLE